MLRLVFIYYHESMYIYVQVHVIIYSDIDTLVDYMHHAYWLFYLYDAGCASYECPVLLVYS